MKCVKFVPAVLAALVLSACSMPEKVATDSVGTVANAGMGVAGTENVAHQSVQTVSEAGSAENTQLITQTQPIATAAKSVVYHCLNNVKVSATYAFDGEKPKAVNLKVGKKAINGLSYDSQDKDSVTFKSASYEWSLENDFYQDPHSAGGMLTKKGKSFDQIIAKLCEVNKTTTKRLDK